MNIQKGNARSEQITWVGVSCVVPEEGSFQQKRGLRGGYGFVAFKSNNIENGIRALASELSKGGTRLSGFEWLTQLQDNERELTELDYTLIDRLDKYPVQFEEMHWFTDE